MTLFDTTIEFDYDYKHYKYNCEIGYEVIPLSKGHGHTPSIPAHIEDMEIKRIKGKRKGRMTKCPKWINDFMWGDGKDFHGRNGL